MKATIDLSEFRYYDKIPHRINTATATVARKPLQVQGAVMKAFYELPEDKKGDTFYCAVIDKTGEKFFIEYNGHGGYTMLLPEEH